MYTLASSCSLANPGRSDDVLRCLREHIFIRELSSLKHASIDDTLSSDRDGRWASPNARTVQDRCGPGDPEAGGGDLDVDLIQVTIPAQSELQGIESPTRFQVEKRFLYVFFLLLFPLGVVVEGYNHQIAQVRWFG